MRKLCLALVLGVSGVPVAGAELALAPAIPLSRRRRETAAITI